MNRAAWFTLTFATVALAGCGAEPQAPQYGPNPDLPEPKRGLLPSMVIAEPAAWGDRLPTVPEGYGISAIAKDLKIPRQTLVLPNGDILVAESRGGNAPKLKPKDVIAGYIKAKGTTSVESGNRLTSRSDLIIWVPHAGAPTILRVFDGRVAGRGHSYVQALPSTQIYAGLRVTAWGEGQWILLREE